MPEERRLKKTDTRLRPTNTPDNECLLDCERRAKTEVACDKGGLGNRGGRISFTFNCLVAFYIHVPVFKLHSHRPETVSITGTKMILFFAKGKLRRRFHSFHGQHRLRGGPLENNPMVAVEVNSIQRWQPLHASTASHLRLLPSILSLIQSINQSSNQSFDKPYAWIGRLTAPHEHTTTEKGI